MTENSGKICELGNPYKLVDCTREHKKGMTARTLEELINTARVRFALPTEAKLTIVLEQDGTEIDDEEYFATIEKNTSLMILKENEKWSAANTGKVNSRFLAVDATDNSDKNHTTRSKEKTCCRLQIGSMVSSLHNEPSNLSLLAGTDLETLSDMDPDSVADIASDRLFIEQLKEASHKFLAEKRQAHESMTLLHMFASNAEAEHT